MWQPLTEELAFCLLQISFKLIKSYLNNVYDKDSPLGVSKILLGMNFGNLDLFINGEKLDNTKISNWKQTIHMKEARFTTSFNYKNIAEISYSIYALRNVQYSGYIDFEIKTSEDIDLKIIGKIQTPKEYNDPISTFRILKDAETTMSILQTVSKSRLGRHTVATSATFIWHNINSTREDQRPELKHEKVSDYDNQLSFEKKIAKGENYKFAWTAAQCSTQDFYDPQTESERFVIFNLLTPRDDLLSQHKKLWENLWKGDIIIEGDHQSSIRYQISTLSFICFFQSRL